MYDTDHKLPPQAGDDSLDGWELDFPLETLDTHHLLLLRAQIDTRLPATALADLDLATELVIQYQVAKALQTMTLAGNEEANRKAQVVNTTSSTLQALVKAQAEFHSSERFKTLETLMIASLKLMPVDAAAKFLEEYEKLGKLGA